MKISRYFRENRIPVDIYQRYCDYLPENYVSMCSVDGLDLLSIGGYKWHSRTRHPSNQVLLLVQEGAEQE